MAAAPPEEPASVPSPPAAPQERLAAPLPRGGVVAGSVFFLWTSVVGVVAVLPGAGGFAVALVPCLLAIAATAMAIRWARLPSFIVADAEGVRARSTRYLLLGVESTSLQATWVSIENACSEREHHQWQDYDMNTGRALATRTMHEDFLLIETDCKVHRLRWVFRENVADVASEIQARANAARDQRVFELGGERRRSKPEKRRRRRKNNTGATADERPTKGRPDSALSS